MLKNLLGSAMQGVMGNLSEMDMGKATQEYGKYLISDEKITNAFTLVRDVVLFTNIRIMVLDKQGATGQKMSVKSILLMNVVDVSMETAGVADDGEINITYIQNAKRNSMNASETVYKLEFPKQLDLVPLYTYLYELAYSNRLELNEMKQVFKRYFNGNHKRPFKCPQTRINSEWQLVAIQTLIQLPMKQLFGEPSPPHKVIT